MKATLQKEKSTATVQSPNKNEADTYIQSPKSCIQHPNPVNTCLFPIRGTQHKTKSHTPLPMQVSKPGGFKLTTPPNSP